MHHATGILLYRPFISEGHLPAPSDRRTARRALSRCAAASLAIDRVLRLYTAHLDVAQAPYFMSYAAYASATFHVRAAARASTAGGVGAAHGYLRTCLDVLGAQAGFGRAPARTLRILRGLMKRLGVRLDAAKTTAALPAAPAAVVADGGVHVPTPSSPPALPDFDVLYTGFDDMAMPDVDMDQLMRTFAVDPWPQADLEPPQGLDGQPFGITPAASADGYVPPVADDLFFPDLLFGFDFDMGLPDAER